MEDKIITLATLTYERAQVIKTVLQNEGINSFLEHVNLIQGAISSGVQINIREIDFEKAMMVFDSIKESDFEEKHKKFDLESDIKIMVPVDFSEYSTKAMNFALDWVKVLKGEILLFNTYFSPISSGFPFNDAYVYDINVDDVSVSLKEDCEEKMKELKGKVEKRISEENINGVELKTVIKRGIAEHEILGYSKIYNPSVIVMGTRGGDKKVLDLIGSVTAEIMELAKMPVLAVPESFNYTDIDSINTVGYLAIFSEQDFIALEQLSNIVHPLGVTIKVGHITSSELKEKNKIMMDGLLQHFRKNPIKTNIEFNLIENEDFLVGVESFVQKENIDILSFTTYKRSMISKLLNPSIAKKMLFHSTTPLLVFHA